MASAPGIELSSFAADPRNPRRIYLGGCCYRSENGGVRWLRRFRAGDGAGTSCPPPGSLEMQPRVVYRTLNASAPAETPFKRISTL